MRFFFRKKDESPPFQIQTPLQIVPSNRNFDQLKDCDVALKFWLPEYVKKMIDRMCRFQDTSASNLIRQILFIHLYTPSGTDSPTPFLPSHATLPFPVGLAVSR